MSPVSQYPPSRSRWNVSESFQYPGVSVGERRPSRPICPGGSGVPSSASTAASAKLIGLPTQRENAPVSFVCLL